jgi:hypothetical protein
LGCSKGRRPRWAIVGPQFLVIDQAGHVGYIAKRRDDHFRLPRGAGRLISRVALLGSK